MKASNSKSWCCPSDRELMLRARVNYGWSIRSLECFRKVEPVPDSEMLSIGNVLERARKIDLIEEERIGRMICRLENMKRNTVGDGKANCSMCGVTFGFFRSNFVYCFDCAMAVCEKCRIDTYNSSQEIRMLCKICAENREVSIR
ncbi:rab effector Noc2-like [Stegodyphus dumicola]|uniref:rab effector Noc2-like n=1 Tax=Stegodyphus dumicola TaxID=202533 RepID=UPI0015A8BF86|nr:rab effector Noc2-like [Stegodyphus dumicola]